MPYYLVQVTYTAEGSAALLANLENRIDVVKSAIERLCGKLHGGWFPFGEYDVVLIVYA
ncbi:MAG: GYD domain-containing protein [Thermoproteota archaeon]|nr:GYD domain-containing protein [Thermoproteota archaeon]